MNPSLVKSSLIKLFKEPTRFASREEPLEVEAVAPNEIVAEREKAYPTASKHKLLLLRWLLLLPQTQTGQELSLLLDDRLNRTQLGKD